MSAELSGHQDPRDAVFTSHRPWGRFQQCTTGVPVTVKTMTVDPGMRLSLQRHEHRGEMWQVLEGPVDVTVGDATWAAVQGEMVWIPAGTLHRLAAGQHRGVVLEVCFGHFDEADIERFDDDFARD